MALAVWRRYRVRERTSAALCRGGGTHMDHHHRRKRQRGYRGGRVIQRAYRESGRTGGADHRPVEKRRSGRGDGAVSFLILTPLVMVMFWLILQIALGSIAGSIAQHTASSMASRGSDGRVDFALSTGTSVCEPVEELADRYSGFIVAGETRIEVRGENVSARLAGAPCLGDLLVADTSGRECDNALDGVEVTVGVRAPALLPDGAGLGIGALDRLREVKAASCAPARSTR